MQDEFVFLPGLFGFPELHSMPVMLATRTRIAQRKGCAGVAAAPPRQHILSFFAAGRSPASTTGETGTPKSPGLSSSGIKPGSALAASKVARAFFGISSQSLFGIFALEAELL